MNMPTMSKQLPVDVVNHILLRLPVKTLIRFKCVCKKWYATITHPTFITMHLNRASSYRDGYVQYMRLLLSHVRIQFLHCDPTSVNHDYLGMPFTSPSKLFGSLGTVNGVICLSSNVYHGISAGIIVLWNPSIRKFKTLPSSTMDPQYFCSNNSILLGFGFCRQSNDYKVVRILFLRNIHNRYIANSPPQVEIYTLGTNSWRRIEAVAPCFPYGSLNAYINGYVHWVATRTAIDRRRTMVMSFDIGDEVFGKMDLPNYSIAGVRCRDLSLAVLKESLSLLVCSSNAHCYIWVMREYGVAESWTKQYTISLPEGQLERSLGFTKNNELLLERKDKFLLSCDLESLQLKDLGGIHLHEHTMNLVPFKETLVLLEEGNARWRQEDLFEEVSSKRILLGKRKVDWGLKEGKG